MSGTTPLPPSAFEGWLRQPTTIAGIGALVAALSGLLAHLSTGNPTVDAIAAAVGFALPHLLINDNSALK